MQLRRIPMLLVACLLAASCGSGGDSVSSPTSPVPTPAPAPVLPSIVRLRTALPLGQELQVQPVAVQITTVTYKSFYPDNAVTIVDHSDPRLRWFGGRFADGTTYPADAHRYGQAVTNGDISLLAGTGLPGYRLGINNGVEFTLPQNQNEFELVLLDAGVGLPMTMLVDGKLTNASGYDLDLHSTGEFKYSRIVLPPSSSARKIALDFGYRPFRNLR